MNASSFHYHTRNDFKHRNHFLGSSPLLYLFHSGLRLTTHGIRRRWCRIQSPNIRGWLLEGLGYSSNRQGSQRSYSVRKKFTLADHSLSSWCESWLSTMAIPYLCHCGTRHSPQYLWSMMRGRSDRSWRRDGKSDQQLLDSHFETSNHVFAPRGDRFASLPNSLYLQWQRCQCPTESPLKPFKTADKPPAICLVAIDHW